MFEHVHFKHRVVEARWDDFIGRWRLKIENSDFNIIEDECEVLINACGSLKYVIYVEIVHVVETNPELFLSTWKWPNIEGIDTYKGFLVHSAAWDPSYSFKGKTVGIIGSGSSAIQIVAVIQKGG